MEKLNKFIEDKWENYSWGLSLGVSLKDASGKSHYFNGGMKASSKLDF